MERDNPYNKLTQQLLQRNKIKHVNLVPFIANLLLSLICDFIILVDLTKIVKVSTATEKVRT